MKTARLLGVAVTVASCVACGNGPTSPTPQSVLQTTAVASVVSVSITPEISTLSVGQTQRFSASVELSAGMPPAGGTLPQWSSTNSAVLELDASGNARAVSVGESIVQASVAGKTTSRSIRVIP